MKIVGKDGQKLYYGEIGELFIKGKNLFSYYYGNQSKTEQVFENEWFKTGDLALED